MDCIQLKRISEISECVGVLNAFSECLKTLKYSSFEEKRKFAKKFIDNGHVVLAENRLDDNPMGFIAYYANDSEKRVAFISMIAVLPQYRNEHVGTSLINYCISDCIKRGMKVLKLEVAKTNKEARIFYMKRNFKKESETTSSSLFLQKNIDL